MRHTGLTVSDAVVRETMELCNHFTESRDRESCCFHASERCSENFKKWTGLQNMKRTEAAQGKELLITASL
jgi:hypothetical protein